MRLVDRPIKFVTARLELLSDTANAAARYLAHEAPTVIPPAYDSDCAPPVSLGRSVCSGRVHCGCLDCEGPASASLEQLLDASCALEAAVERIEVIDGNSQWRPGFCSCDEDLTLPAEVYRVTTRIPLRAQTLCSVECVAYALLWDLHPQQDQSHGPLTRVVGAIERSFAGRS